MYRRDDLLLFNELLQDPEFPGLKATDTSLWEEPNAHVFVGAVKNFNLIICRGVIDRAAAILLEELEKHLTPGMVQEGEDFLSERFQSVDADRLNGLLNRFAPGIHDTFNVEVFGFQNF